MAGLSIGIIGCGYWGANFARIFSELPATRVAVCCDRNPERLDYVRQLHRGVRVTGDAGGLLNDPRIQAVCIATGAASHHALAKAALNAGKHVLVEKPFTLSAPHARSLIRLAKKRGRVLMVGHTYLYNEGVDALKRYVENGDTGDLLYIYTQRTNLGPVRDDVNVLWDLAAHDVSILLHLTGSLPESVAAHGQSYIRAGIEDIVFADLHFPKKIIANIQASWLDPVKTRRVTAIGAKKMVVFDDVNVAEPIRIYDKGFTHSVSYDSFGEYQLLLREGDATIPRIKRSEPLKNECRRFVECVKTGAEPLTGGENGLQVVRVLSALQKSLETGGARMRTSDF